MDRRQIPNALTVARLALVPPVGVAVLAEWYGWALLLFIAAGVSDAVDGFLARRFAWQSDLGGVLDPIADKALVITTFLTLAVVGRLPWWFLGLVVARDLVIGVGALAYRWVVGPFRAAPMAISKATTLALLVFAVVLLLPWADARRLAALTEGLLLLCTGLVLASGVAYAIVWGGAARARLQAGDGGR